MAHPTYPYSEMFHYSVLDRFWSKVQVGEPDECWPWEGREVPAWGSKLVYPRFAWGLRDGRIQQHAHRLACWLKHGPFAHSGMWALHSCDNPACCNPDHLRWGTPQENAQDAIDRGRHASVTQGSKSTQWKASDTCHNGHPWTPETTYEHTRPDGRVVRTCRECRNDRLRRKRRGDS